MSKFFAVLTIVVAAFVIIGMASEAKHPTTTSGAAVPPGCHGHTTADNHWTFDRGPSPSEAREIFQIVDHMKQLDPSGSHDVADVASAIDQMECQGISHQDAVQLGAGPHS